MQEKLVQTKQCAKYWTKFDITDKNVKFYQKVNPKFNWKVYQTPTSTLCPDCRQQRRSAFWSPKKLYDRKCDKCWKNTKTTFSLNRPEIVYCQECYNQEIH